MVINSRHRPAVLQAPPPLPRQISHKQKKSGIYTPPCGKNNNSKTKHLCTNVAGLWVRTKQWSHFTRWPEALHEACRKKLSTPELTVKGGTCQAWCGTAISFSSNRRTLYKLRCVCVFESERQTSYANKETRTNEASPPHDDKTATNAINARLKVLLNELGRGWHKLSEKIQFKRPWRKTDFENPSPWGGMGRS